MRRFVPWTALLLLGACDGTTPRDSDAGTRADGGRDGAVGPVTGARRRS